MVRKLRHCLVCKLSIFLVGRFGPSRSCGRASSSRPSSTTSKCSSRCLAQKPRLLPNRLVQEIRRHLGGGLWGGEPSGETPSGSGTTYWSYWSFNEHSTSSGVSLDSTPGLNPTPQPDPQNLKLYPQSNPQNLKPPTQLPRTPSSKPCT